MEIERMTVMVSFANSFLSYLMLMLVIVVVAGCGFVLGLFLRKRKEREDALEAEEAAKE